MELKKVLKIDWRRIILAILLILPVSGTIDTLTSGMYLEPFGYQKPLLIELNFGIFFSLFISIIFSYLLSCLIIFGWDRLFRKQK